MDEPLLTANEVAEQLRVSTMTIYRLIRRGELPAVRVGRNYRVRASALDTYLAGQVVDPASVDLGEAFGDIDGREPDHGAREGA